MFKKTAKEKQFYDCMFNKNATNMGAYSKKVYGKFTVRKLLAILENG